MNALIAPPVYCVGTCICGKNCHENYAFHVEVTGAPTSDQYADGTISFQLDADIDDDLFAYAMQVLGGQA